MGLPWEHRGCVPRDLAGGERHLSMDLGQLELCRLSRAGPTFVGPCISSSAWMGAGISDLSCAMLGLCQVPPVRLLRYGAGACRDFSCNIASISTSSPMSSELRFAQRRAWCSAYKNNICIFIYLFFFLLELLHYLWKTIASQAAAASALRERPLCWISCPFPASFPLPACSAEAAAAALAVFLGCHRPLGAVCVSLSYRCAPSSPFCCAFWSIPLQPVPGASDVALPPPPHSSPQVASSG